MTKPKGKLLPNETESQKIARASWQCERCRIFNSGLRKECQACGKKSGKWKNLDLVFTNY